MDPTPYPPRVKTLTIPQPVRRECPTLIAWLKTLLRRLWPDSGVGRARASRLQFDPDLGEVFIAELGEVAQSLGTAFARWRANPNDQEALKSLRRGFHTLKGAAPLIGATALSEVCAHSERLTTRLMEAPAKVTPEVIATVEQAVAVLPTFAQSMRDARPSPSLRPITDRLRRISL